MSGKRHLSGLGLSCSSSRPAREVGGGLPPTSHPFIDQVGARNSVKVVMPAEAFEDAKEAVKHAEESLAHAEQAGHVGHKPKDK